MGCILGNFKFRSQQPHGLQPRQIRVAAPGPGAPVPRLPRVAARPRAEDGAHPWTQRHRPEHTQTWPMHLRDFQRFLVEEERGAAVRSEHASHLAEGRAVKFRETTSRRVLPVEGRAADDLCATSASGAPDSSSLSHFSVMTRPCWLGRAARNRHRHAIEQASRRWRGGRRGDSDERTVKF